ncbi:MAG: organic solvent tolerance protein OstA, partial [Bacteroidales bacterium]
FGKAFHNVEVHDSSQNAILKGNYATYHQNPESAMITDSALFIQYSEGDSLFVHADTLSSETDSTGSYKIMRAYYRVKLFKEDLQGKCDSLSYSYSDSVIQLHKNPVLWSDENQLTADTIKIHTRARHVDYIEMQKSAYIISQEDSMRFNQIKGKDMIGYFRNDQLYRINVTGNGQTIYYVKENDEIIGVNKAESSNIIIYLKDKEIQSISLISNPDGILNPPDEIPLTELRLKDFVWHDMNRPKTKRDIFRWD